MVTSRIAGLLGLLVSSLVAAGATGACSGADEAAVPPPVAGDASSSDEAAVKPAGDGAAPTDGGVDGPGTDLVPSGCIDAVTPGDHVFKCEGLAYDVRVPAACKKGGCGVVLDVHGATMSGRMEDNNTNMRAIGEREGYLVIQPNASGSPPSAIWNPPTDYDKVWAFFELALGVFKVDPKRVHMTGFSQGGRMTFTFACKHADRIASAAPAAETGCTAAELTAAKREVPLLYMHGTADALVSFATFAGPQRDAVISAWAMGSPAPVSSDADHAWSRYTNAKGTVFEFIQHDYTAPPALLRGHCYPGSTDPKSVPGQLFSFACSGPNAFVWGEAVMKFFKTHPLP